MAIEQIGANIAKLRKVKGAKQEDIAKAVGVSSQAVSKWENGGTPDTELLPLIADYFGVSIDRLFGRAIADYGDIETEVTKYVAAPLDEATPDEIEGHESWEPPDETLEAVMERANKICWAIIMGSCGTKIMAMSGLSLKHIRDEMQKNMDSEMTMYAQLEHNKGLLLAYMSKTLPLFLLMPEPEQGWYEGLPDMEECRKAFAALADTDTLKCLFVLHGKSSKNRFSLGHFAKITGLDVIKAEKMLESLAELKYVKSSEIELDEAKQTIYEFKPRGTFVAMLALMKAYINPPTHFVLHATNRDKPFINSNNLKGNQS